MTEQYSFETIPSDIEPTTWAWLANRGASLQGPLRTAIRSHRLDIIRHPSWPTMAEAIRTHYGVGVAHLFHAEPHRWTSLIETQVTRGFAHFLDSGALTQRIGRTSAFLRACLPDCAVWQMSTPILSVPIVSAETEAPAARPGPGRKRAHKRIDMLVTLQCEGETIGAVIEGKLGHTAEGNPFAVYERRAKVAGLAPGTDTCACLVVGIRAPAGKLRPGWRFLSWRQLLLRFERSFDPDHDDIEFRRFRRTLWERTA